MGCEGCRGLWELWELWGLWAVGVMAVRVVMGSGVCCRPWELWAVETVDCVGDFRVEFGAVIVGLSRLGFRQLEEFRPVE